MKDPIMNVKDEADLKDLLEREEAEREIYRLRKSGTAMSQVILAHTWGLGDCPGCSQCGL